MMKKQTKTIISMMYQMGPAMGLPMEALVDAFSVLSTEGCWFCGEAKNKDLVDSDRKISLVYGNDIPCSSCQIAMDNGMVLMVVCNEQDHTWYELVGHIPEAVHCLDHAGIMLVMDTNDFPFTDTDDFPYGEKNLELVKKAGFWIISMEEYTANSDLTSLVADLGNCYNSQSTYKDGDINLGRMMSFDSSVPDPPKIVEVVLEQSEEIQ
jgi:hypothetical protein